MKQLARAISSLCLAAALILPAAAQTGDESAPFEIRVGVDPDTGERMASSVAASSGSEGFGVSSKIVHLFLMANNDSRIYFSL